MQHAATSRHGLLPTVLFRNARILAILMCFTVKETPRWGASDHRVGFSRMTFGSSYEKPESTDNAAGSRDGPMLAMGLLLLLG